VLVVGGRTGGFRGGDCRQARGLRGHADRALSPIWAGLASGGMVLVLDDMHNGEEITVTGLCMEMIERMASVGACVYPPPEERGQSLEKYPQMGRAWGCHDFRATGEAAADRDGGGIRSGWLEAGIERDDRAGRRGCTACTLGSPDRSCRTAASVVSSARPRPGVRRFSPTW